MRQILIVAALILPLVAGCGGSAKSVTPKSNSPNAGPGAGPEIGPGGGGLQGKPQSKAVDPATDVK
jgi:hypothetical protein